MKKIILTAVLSIIMQFAFATDYYVSSSTGNDSNDGLTTSTAWKTTNKVNSFALQPGDIVHFKRGDLWYNQSLKLYHSGIVSNPITFTDYGFGTLPEISGLGTFDNTANWTDEGNNVWSITINNTLVPNWTSVYELKRLYINGEEVLGAAFTISTELGTSIPDLVKFHYNNGTQLLKIHSNISPNSLNIEFAFKQNALLFAWWDATNNEVKYLDFENLKFSGGNNSCIVIEKGKYITLTNLDIGDKGNRGLSISTNSQYITIDSCLIDSKYHLDYKNAGTANGTSNRGPREGFYGRWSSYVELKNSTIKNYTHANINLAASAIDQYCEHYSVHDNYSTSNIAYGGRSLVNKGTYFLEFYNNTIDGSDVQNQLLGQNCHYHHNIIKNVKSSPIHSGHSGYGIVIEAYAVEDVLNNIYENNLIMDCESGGIKIANGDFYNEDTNETEVYIVDNCIIRNNILINNGKFVAHLTDHTQNQTSSIDLAIKISGIYDYVNNQFVTPITSNNIFQNNLIYVDGSQPGSNGMARILYHLDDNDQNGWTTAPITVSEFNNQNGQHNDIISNNIEADPKFIDLINGDYHLQETSPAVNAGTTATATIDMDDNAIPFPGTLPDIGLFEYQVQTTNHPPTATNVVIVGTPEVGQTLTLNYDFSDEDGDTENGSIIAWSTPTLELQRSTSATFVIPTDYCSDTIGAWIHPVDSTGNTTVYGIAASNNMLDITCSSASVVSVDRDTFTIYPNPATNFLTVKNQYDFKNYSILNMVGQKIASGILKEETININTLEKGIYFIKISNDKKSMTTQFIKN